MAEELTKARGDIDDVENRYLILQSKMNSRIYQQAYRYKRENNRVCDRSQCTDASVQYLEKTGKPWHRRTLIGGTESLASTAKIIDLPSPPEITTSLKPRAVSIVPKFDALYSQLS